VLQQQTQAQRHIDAQLQHEERPAVTGNQQKPLLHRVQVGGVRIQTNEFAVVNEMQQLGMIERDARQVRKSNDRKGEEMAPECPCRSRVPRQRDLVQVKMEQRSIQEDQRQVRQREQGCEEQPVVLLQRLVGELHDKHEEQGRQPAIGLLVIAGEIQQRDR
jgi:hypothetical protein